jgi:hypothetical protein
VTPATPAAPRTIVVVAMANSIHTARWVAQLPAAWRVHVFSSMPCGVTHPGLRAIPVHHVLRSAAHAGDPGRGLPVPGRDLAYAGERAVDRLFPSLRARRLAALLRALRPDAVHSLEMQHAGWLALQARALHGPGFPRWIVTNWGSDIQAFHADPVHGERLRAMLRACDVYTCECERDVGLAREMGFRGRVHPVSPNAGGFDLEAIAPLRAGPPSSRSGILLKGYHGWAGRALVGVRALERVSDLLPGKHLTVYSADREVVEAAHRLGRKASIPVETFGHGDPLPHEEMLRRHGRARVSIGLSMSDGISTSFLEAFVMGAFPVQSWTSCAGEWIEDGRSGLLVPPEDEEAVAAALRRALADDRLVDDAAVRNVQVARVRLDGAVLAASARALYEDGGSAP